MQGPDDGNLEAQRPEPLVPVGLDFRGALAGAFKLHEGRRAARTQQEPVWQAHDGVLQLHQQAALALGYEPPSLFNGGF